MLIAVSVLLAGLAIHYMVRSAAGRRPRAAIYAAVAAAGIAISFAIAVTTDSAVADTRPGEEQHVPAHTSGDGVAPADDTGADVERGTRPGGHGRPGQPDDTDWHIGD